MSKTTTAGAAGRGAGDLDRVLDRLGAGVEEQRLLLLARARRQLAEAPADVDVWLVGPDHEALVQVAVDLRVDRGGDGLEAVPGVLAADPAGEVDVLVAVDVDDGRAVGAVDDESWRRHAARDPAGPLLEDAAGRRVLPQGHRGDSPCATPAVTTARVARCWRCLLASLSSCARNSVALRSDRPPTTVGRDVEERRRVLTVRDIAELPGLSLAVAAGAEGLGTEIRWLHVSELADPTAWLEGGELLLTTGLGVGDLASTQRAYVRRLADHGLAGLCFGLGFGFADVPPALVEEANRRGFPVVAVPYDTPFIAITKAAFAHLANEELERVTQALEVQERLAQAVLDGARRAGAARDPLRTAARLARARGRERPRDGRAPRGPPALVRRRPRAARRRPRRDGDPQGRARARVALGLRPARAAPRPDRARVRALA